MNISKKSSPEIYIFDICDTLYNSNTTFDFCKWRKNKKYWEFLLWFSSTILGKLINKISITFFKKEFSRNLHLKSLSNINKDELYKEAILFTEIFLNKKKINYTHNILEKLKNKNKDIYLISASIDPVVEAISKHLNVKFISSELLYIDNICQGSLKKDLLGNKHNLNFINLSLVVTDNISDYQLCRMSEQSLIIINSKNKNFWIKNKLNGMILYEK